MHTVLVLRQAYPHDSFRRRKWVAVQGRWFLVSHVNSPDIQMVSICRSWDGEWHPKATIWARRGLTLEDAVRALSWMEVGQLDAMAPDAEPDLLGRLLV